MRGAEYVVLDIETTGLSPGRHGITELYAARTDGFGNKKKEFHSLINPGHPIPSFITSLTGITNAMVADAPPATKIIRDFAKFLPENAILVGHNLRFDLSFLEYERRKALHSSFSNDTLCTLLLARRVFSPDPLPSYRLGVLANHLQISSLGAHRAQKDVEMTIALKQELFRRLEAAGKNKLPDVLKLQYMPLCKATKMFE
jgi:DNA polymerase-3 subunit epsilon